MVSHCNRSGGQWQRNGIDKLFHFLYAQRVAKERAITKVVLDRAFVGGKPGWVHARWERSDGSKGDVVAHLRAKTPARWYIAELLVGLPTTAKLRDIPL